MRIIILIVLSSVTIIGCSTLKIESNRDMSYDKQIQKIFFVLKGSMDLNTFFQETEKHFKRALYERKISSKIFNFDPLSLTDYESAFKSQIDEFKPDVIFYIVQKEGYRLNYHGGGGYGGYKAVFEATIKDVTTTNTVWKGSILVETSGYFLLTIPMKDASQKFVNGIIKKLEKDKLINGVVTKINES